MRKRLFQTFGLAVRAEVGAALGYSDFVDDAAAAFAGLTVSAVDIKVLLRIAAAAVWFAIPMDAGAFVFDAGAQ